MTTANRRRRRTDRWVRPLLLFSATFFLLALGLRLLLSGSAGLFSGEPAAPSLAVPSPLPDWIQEDLLPINDYSRPGEAMEAVNGIVIHYTGNPGTTARQNRNYFASLAKTHETWASSNFIIGLEGEVLLCVPIGEVAYCSNSRNSDTLSIEVCHPDDTGEFTQASYASLLRLVNWLREFYDLDTQAVIRHYDVTGKECPRYFVRHPEAWEAFLADLEESTVMDAGAGN